MNTLPASAARLFGLALMAAALAVSPIYAGDPATSPPAGESVDLPSTAAKLLAEDRAEDAARQLDAWLKFHPDDPDILYLRAIAARNGGNVTAALLCLNRAMHFRPEAQQDADPASPWNQLLSQLGAAFLSPAANGGAKAPAWTWPPAPVLLSTTPLASLLPAAPAAPIKSSVVPAAELPESVILKESQGQWAAQAKASSEYGSDNYGAAQATGAPNISSYADDGRAWASASADSQKEWIELTYARAVHATGVRIRQTFNPGAMVQIELFDENGQSHVAWSGVDPARGGKSDISWFAVKFAATSFATQRVRLTIDSPAVSGWNEIDAVQLVGE